MGLILKSDHIPRTDAAALRIQRNSQRRSGDTSSINALVNRPTSQRRGAPTQVMKYGVTITRVLADYVNSVEPLRIDE